MPLLYRGPVRFSRPLHPQRTIRHRPDLSEVRGRHATTLPCPTWIHAFANSPISSEYGGIAFLRPCSDRPHPRIGAVRPACVARSLVAWPGSARTGSRGWSRGATSPCHRPLPAGWPSRFNSMAWKRSTCWRSRADSMQRGPVPMLHRPRCWPSSKPKARNPAYVADGLGSLKAWNQAAHLVFDGFGQGGHAEPNLLRYMFLFDGSHAIVDWERYARKMVAQFRLRHDRAGTDDRFARLSAELREGSGVFGALWAEHEVRHRATGRQGDPPSPARPPGVQLLQLPGRRVTRTDPDPPCPFRGLHGDAGRPADRPLRRKGMSAAPRITSLLPDLSHPRHLPWHGTRTDAAWWATRARAGCWSTAPSTR